MRIVTLDAVQVAVDISRIHPILLNVTGNTDVFLAIGDDMTISTPNIGLVTEQAVVFSINEVVGSLRQH